MRDIDQADVDHWHQHGYVIIKEFLDPDELKAGAGKPLPVPTELAGVFTAGPALSQHAGEFEPVCPGVGPL